MTKDAGACQFEHLTRIALWRRRALWCVTCGAIVPDSLEALNTHLVDAEKRRADERR